MKVPSFLHPFFPKKEEKMESLPYSNIIQFITDTFGFSPKDVTLYDLAFKHSSANETNSIRSTDNYERLEFLGDAVLSAVVSDFLFVLFPELREGKLSQIKSKVVSRESLTHLGHHFGFSNYIQHNIKDVEKASHVVGNVLEAFVGAMYLDGGFEFTKKIVIDYFLSPHFKAEELMTVQKDYKSLLYQYCQKNKLDIEFRVLKEQHANGERYFEMALYIDGKYYGESADSSKKKIEQRLSELVYQQIIKDNIEKNI